MMMVMLLVTVVMEVMMMVLMVLMMLMVVLLLMVLMVLMVLKSPAPLWYVVKRVLLVAAVMQCDCSGAGGRCSHCL